MTTRSFAFGDISREHRRSFPDGVAVIDGDVRLTWPQFDDRTNRLASRLTEEGIQEGDRIVWLAQTSSRVLELLVAAAKVGAMLCPVNWRQSVDEIAFVIEDIDPSIIFWQEEEIGEGVLEASKLAGKKALWIRHDASGPNTYEEFLAAGPDADPAHDIDPGLPLLVLYTAGFGGRPAGSMLSHRNLLTMAAATAPILGASCDGVFLNPGPLFHLGGYQFESLPVFLSGGTNVFIRRVIPEELLRIIHDERCTGVYVMPPTIMQMVEINADRRYDLSCLKGGPFAFLWAGMVAADASQWSVNPGGYGQTEVAGMAILNGYGGRGTGNSGRPAPFVRVRIVDEDGSEVPVGEVGEIVVDGEGVHLGFWNRPELNEHRFRGGWWHTTDLGTRHPDGTISFLGTQTRMIRSAAENIYPAEVESCLESHPAIKEAAVIGVPDPKFVQSVKAIVVVEPGRTLSASEVIEHCRSTIASYKKPKSVEFIAALPRRDGKTDHAALDDQFGGGNYPGQAVY